MRTQDAALALETLAALERAGESAAGRTVCGVELSRFYTFVPGRSGAGVLDEGSFIAAGEDIAVRKHDPRDPGEMHAHNFFELIYLDRGSAVNRLSGQCLTLREGSLFLLRPGVRHGIKCGTGDIVLNILVRSGAFGTAFLEILALSGILAAFFTEAMRGSGAQGDYILFDTGGDGQIRELALLLLRESLEDKRYKGAVMDNLLVLLFTFLISGHEEGMTLAVPTPRRYHHYKRIVDYVTRNCASATLAGIAGEMHFSTRHICRILRESWGGSFCELLRGVRIARARELLAGTSLPVERIAQEVGYADATYLIRVFRRCEGVTPAAWRKNVRAGRSGAERTGED